MSNILYIDNTADFRTNLGMIETSGSGSTVVLHLYDGSGNPVGEDQTVNLGAYEDKQIDGILNSFGVSSGSNYRVAFEVVSGSAIPYSSQVDNQSGDPIYIDGSVARQGGGGSCGNGKYFGYIQQTNNADWKGYINSTLNVKIDNYKIMAWDEEDQGIIYITPKSDLIMLSYDKVFSPPIQISEGENFSISYSVEYSYNGSVVLKADFSINGILYCNNLIGTIEANVVSLSHSYDFAAGRWTWNFKAGLQ